MVPKEINFIKRPRIDLFFAITRLPPQDVQRIPTMVRLMMILSRSNSAISYVKLKMQQALPKKMGRMRQVGDE